MQWQRWNHQSISEYSKLAQKEYKTRHDWVGKVIHWEMCKKFKFDHTNKWYMHNPAPIIPIVICAFGTVAKGLLKRLENLKVGGRVETIQTTKLLKTTRALRRVLETWGYLLSLKLQWKTISWYEKLKWVNNNKCTKISNKVINFITKVMENWKVV